jgi:hypothetical protein
VALHFLHKKASPPHVSRGVIDVEPRWGCLEQFFIKTLSGLNVGNMKNQNYFVKISLSLS